METVITFDEKNLQPNVRSLLDELKEKGFLQGNKIVYEKENEKELCDLFDKYYVPLDFNLWSFHKQKGCYKMKKTYLFLLTMLMSMVSNIALAYDITVANDEGVTLYYNYINDKKRIISGKRR